MRPIHRPLRPALNTDPGYLDLLECGRLLDAKAISCEELVHALLRRIDAHDPRLNCFIAVYHDEALASARKCDAEMARSGRRSPLHGIPFAAKDIIDLAGRVTSCHSRILAENTATRDARVVTMLYDAGAVLIGKTALHEFATGGPSFDLPWPPARNPWNPAVHPGGSSSGSGVALAAGFVPFALGTDTGGSVRNPASACGVVGMKPTFGAVSVDGCFPLSFSLDHVGPMTRTVKDNAVALSHMLDPATAAKMKCRLSSTTPFDGVDGDLRGLRIGVIDAFYNGKDVNPEIAATTDAAVDVLKRIGADVHVLKLSPLSTWAECGRTILQSESFAIHADWLRARAPDYGVRGRRRLLAGSMISAERYVRAQQVRSLLVQEFLDAMRDLDVAVTASSLELPCAIDNEALIDKTYDKQARMPFNVTGTPAISIPAGLSASGLPIGLQIAGKPHDEGTVYRAAFGLEQALSLPMRPPIVW